MRISVALSMLVLLHSQPAQAGTKTPQGYAQVMQETINLILKADGHLYEQMEYVARRLERYYTKFHHFPRPGVQENNFKASILKHLVFNPYKPKVTDLYYNKPMPEDSVSHVYMLTDPFMNIDNLRSFHKAAPESWQGDPGSIFIMTNGEGLYAVWGAGADRRPIKDHEHGDKVRMFYHDFSAVTSN